MDWILNFDLQFQLQITRKYSEESACNIQIGGYLAVGFRTT